MTAFSEAWSLLKMPFVNRGLTADKLYQGRRAGEKDSGFWTPHKDKAVAYSLFGQRGGYDDKTWVDPNIHIPEVYSVDAPKENVRLPLDMEYVGMGDASGAIDRRRVAFEDEEGIIPSHNPTKLPNEEMAQIIERILEQTAKDDGYFMEGGEIPKKDFERIFDMKGAFGNWEGMYVEDDYEHGEAHEALEIQYDEGDDIDWDSLVTTLGGVKGGDMRPFIERLRSNAQPVPSHHPYTVSDGLYRWKSKERYSGQDIYNWKSLRPPHPRRDDWMEEHETLFGKPYEESKGRKMWRDED